MECVCCTEKSDLLYNLTTNRKAINLESCCVARLCADCVKQLWTARCPYCQRTVNGAYVVKVIPIRKVTNHLRWNPRRKCRK